MMISSVFMFAAKQRGKSSQNLNVSSTKTVITFDSGLNKCILKMCNFIEFFLHHLNFNNAINKFQNNPINHLSRGTSSVIYVRSLLFIT